MQILIVEDNPQMRRMLKQTLQRAFQNTLQFFECEDGLDAVEMYRRFMPDWVLMDIQLEKMDGLRATEAIMREYPQAQVLIVSSYNDAAYRSEAAHVGARGYVQKDDLNAVVEILSDA